MKHSAKAALKYFETHCHAHTKKLAEALAGKIWDRVAFIPARAEETVSKSTIPSLARSSEALSLKSLLILHVNGSADSLPQDHETNTKLMQELRAWAKLTEGDQGNNSEAFLIESPFLDIFVIDSASADRLLPERGGVGLARKIPADIAAWLIFQQQVRCPYLYSTDADALVPLDYFSESRLPADNAPAGIFSFKHYSHSSDPLERTACQLYDQYLRFYVGGLKFAGSPFAFQSIGSLMVIHAESYIHVRGFSNLMAGEDFYLLNKLAKLGPVFDLPGDPVELSGRVSVRVPFGTGNSIRLYLQDLRANQEILYYDPQVFGLLKILLNEISTLATSRNLIEWKKNLSTPAIEAWIESSGMQSAFEKILRGATSSKSLRIQLMIWFDGFRTMKAIHFWRDRFYPSMPWHLAVRSAPWMDLKRSLEQMSPSELIMQKVS